MECIIRTPRYEALRTADKTIFIVLPTDPRLSDADAARAPTQLLPTRDEQGLVNYYEKVDETIDRLWREKLGRYLYDHVVKEDLKRLDIRPRANPDKVYLTNFPANYTLWVHKKGHPHDPRKDHYLYGQLEPGSPSKILSRRQKTSFAPSSKASAAARDVLMKFARTNNPGSIARALPSYAEDPDILARGAAETEDSYIAREALRIRRARCCWEIIKEGFIQRDGSAISSSPRKKRSRRIARGKDADDDGWAVEDSLPPASVSEYAWGVLGWLLTLFERDEADMEQTVQVRYSPLLLDQIPPSRAERTPRWDIDMPLDVAFYALQQESQAKQSLGVRLLALLINLGSTTLLDFPMFLNAASPRVSGLPTETLEALFAALPVTSATAQFKIHLCRHALGGSFTSARTRPKPQARARPPPRRRIPTGANRAGPVYQDAPTTTQDPGASSVARTYPAMSTSDVLELLTRPSLSDSGPALLAFLLKAELVVSYGLLQQQACETDRDGTWADVLRDGALAKAVEAAFDPGALGGVLDSEDETYVEKRRAALLAMLSVWQM
ncbi:hypothetical protein BC628DRAFT_1411431 [Trametes gibbosa]|nr:hypothetical protein BC628DRAFT_1411431 [Trametes gibbosa]